MNKSYSIEEQVIIRELVTRKVKRILNQKISERKKIENVFIDNLISEEVASHNNLKQREMQYIGKAVKIHINKVFDLEQEEKECKT